MTRFLLACACCMALVATARADQTDEAALKQLSNDFVATWNRHDATALADFWAADGDLISTTGQLAANRREVAELLRNDQTGNGPYRESTYELNNCAVRLITPTVAVVDWQTVLSGVLAPNGETVPPQVERVTFVLTKQDGKWKFAAVRPGSLNTSGANTNTLQTEADAAAAAEAAQVAPTVPVTPPDTDTPDKPADANLPSDRSAE